MTQIIKAGIDLNSEIKWSEGLRIAKIAGIAKDCQNYQTGKSIIAMFGNFEAMQQLFNFLSDLENQLLRPLTRFFSWLAPFLFLACPCDLALVI